jgi:hypothetical protein
MPKDSHQSTEHESEWEDGWLQSSPQQGTLDLKSREGIVERVSFKTERRRQLGLGDRAEALPPTP